MRERITIAFVVLAMAVLLGAGTVRAYTLRDLLREQEGAHLSNDVVLIGELVANQRAAGQPVDEEFLQSVVADDHPARVRRPVRADRSWSRATSTPATRRATTSPSTASTDVGMITVSKQPEVVGDILGRDTGSLVTLFLLIGAARRPRRLDRGPGPVRPFQRLAVAARALGRGRFDLDLPKTRVPEAQAIGKALQTSAHELAVPAQPGARLRRARVPRAADPAHVAAPRARGHDPARRRTRGREGGRGPLHPQRRRGEPLGRRAGRAVPTGQPGRGRRADPARPGHPARPALGRPAGREATHRCRRRPRATCSMAFTPGPVEHVLDLVLSDIVQGGKGPVKITFLGEDDHLRIRMPAGVVPNGARRRRGRAARASASPRPARWSRPRAAGSPATVRTRTWRSCCLVADRAAVAVSDLRR